MDGRYVEISRVPCGRGCSSLNLEGRIAQVEPHVTFIVRDSYGRDGVYSAGTGTNNALI